MNLKLVNLKKNKKVAANGKGIKRMFYRGRITKFKSLISTMVIVGFVFAFLYLCKFVYSEYAAAKVDVALTFPEIAESKYPDGSRFNYYDLISDDKLEETLDIMKSRGVYEGITVEDIKKNFYITSYLESSAGASVSSERSEGNDFSYVANEYQLSFVQPHDYKNSNLLVKFFGFDYSKEFLDVLISVNRSKIADEMGGINSFKILSSVDSTKNYDYSEELDLYRTKIQTLKSFLSNLDKKKASFVSEKYGLSINDIKNRYDFLISNKLNGISDFVSSSGISKDKSLASNKLAVNIEDSTLKYNKYKDRSEINGFAQTNYDQTFTENLINVVQNKEYGLYQARPKTAFDTVVNQKHIADEDMADMSVKISQYNKELETFTLLEQTPEEHKRLTQKADKLIASFEKEYNKLTSIAIAVVSEFYNNVNEKFITANITRKSLLSKGLVVKAGLAFALGAVIAFVFVVFITSYKDSKKLKRKKKLISEMKSNSTEKGA